VSPLSGDAEGLLKKLVMFKSSEDDDALPIAEFVSEYLMALGLEPSRHGDADKPAVFARHGTGGVVLSGHLDTVPQGKGWTKQQGEVVDGVLYGRGTADMKGGCAAILLAVKDLIEDGTPFAVCLTLDEEISMNGAIAVAEAGLLRDAPAVLVAEPTAFDIVVREKGLIQFAIKTTGKSAHASMPVLGDNAITKMTTLLHRIGDLQKIPEDPFKELTLCVNKISGGTQVNVIPDICEAEADSRFPPNMTGEDVLNLVRQRFGDAEYEMRTMHLLEPVETDPDLPAVKTLHDVVGEEARILSVPYATEMVMFKRDNSTLMVCGPGEPTQAHVTDEHIEIDQVSAAAGIYREYCRRMAAGE
jgi:acetylornithine deacetylase/succinyl-diaminopimelate desuccinylase-like protein